MKKTMLALMATVGLAFGAKAEVLNSTGFENYTGDFNYAKDDTGGTEGSVYWVVTNATPDLSGTVLTEYGVPPAYVHVPWAFTNTVNDTYLKVDTSNEVLYRSVAAVGDSQTLNAGTPIGDGGLYFDANVQFTASDGEPTYDSADKLVVWLKATEGENPTTNLVVTAAASADEYGVPQNITDFVVSNVAVDADTWYRLTVKAAVDASDHTYFNIYVDNNQVVATDRTDFYSMVNSNTTEGQRITAVGFQGTGAVDNLVWTTDDPFPAPVVDTVALTIDLTDDDAVFAGLAANAKVVNVAAPAPIVATVDDEITFVAKVPDGYTPTVEDYDLQKSAEKDEDDNYAYTFTVTVTQAMINNGLTLTITVTADGGGDDEPAQVVPGTPAEVEAESADAAVAKAEKVIPEAVKTAVGAGGETYLSYFELVATETETPGTYNVEMKLTEAAEAALEEDADDGVEDLLDAVNALTGEETEASANVTVPAGFYWALSSGTTLEGMTNDAGLTPSTGTVNLSTTKGTDDTAGFYQLLISPTPIPSTKE